MKQLTNKNINFFNLLCNFPMSFKCHAADFSYADFSSSQRKKKKVAFLQYCIRNTNILFKFPHKQPSLQLPSPKPSKMNHKNTWLVKRQKQNVKFWKTDYSLLLLLRNKQ